MTSRKIWEINEGLETFPPNTTEYLYIEVEVPDFILTYTLSHTKSADDFTRMGIKPMDITDYVEGEHVFFVNFVMQDNYQETESRNIKISAPAYLDMVNGTPYHILVKADNKR